MNDDLLALTHTGDDYEKYLGAVVPPVFLNSLHVFKTYEDYANTDPFDENSFIYGRVSNPTVLIAEKKIAQLENGKRAAIFSSGMAAASATIMATCKAGSHVICLRNAYPPVVRFLNTVCVPRLNMSVTYVTGQSLAEIEAAIRPETSLIILESPASLVFSVTDLRAVAEIAKKHGIKTFTDNTYCSPLFQKPLDLGIDVSMHTMSKYLGGHSDIIGGVLVSKDEALMRCLMTEMREWFGGIMGPMEAWLVTRSLRTLAVRLNQHQETAVAIAKYLQNHPKVRRVFYTGLESHPQAEIIAKQQTGHTGLMSFLPDAPPEASVKLINELKLFGIGVSWGGFESLALTPLYKATEEELGFLSMPDGRGLIRIYCGLEGTGRLIEDLEQALKKV
jgi:cystathionine gamma-lyase